MGSKKAHWLLWRLSQREFFYARLNVQIVLEADPSIECPIDLPEKDQPVLVAAISAKADYLLTGDIEHFGKYFGQRIMDVRICMARDYLLQYLDS
jgi:predicted nucleic acid-binding protein